MADNTSSAQTDTQHPDPDAALRHGLQQALLERGIADPDDDTVRMLLYAARIPPLHQPSISGTRLLLAAVEAGDGARAGSYLGALAETVARDSKWQEIFRRVRAEYDAETEPAERALARLAPKWFSNGVETLIGAAVSERGDLALSGIIVRRLLSDSRVNARFPGLLELAQLVQSNFSGLAAGLVSTNVWLFYGTEGQWAARRIDALETGRVFFWRHNSVAYTKRMHVGDSVVMMIGSPERGSRGMGGRIIATGLLAADASAVFMDKRQGRRYPVLCVDGFQDHPIDRREVEAAIGAKLVSQQGTVHRLSAKAIGEINKRLASRSRHRLPIDANAADAAFKNVERLESALGRYPDIRMDDETARSLQWPPIGPWHFPPRPPKPVGPVAQDDLGYAHVPFRSDTPRESEDALERGKLAYFLARRLHLIWCEKNGCPQRLSSELTASNSGAALVRNESKFAEPDTFIVHVDAPWGGGKTTFANFVAGVLDPRGKPLTEHHFLRWIARSGATPEELAATNLDEIFFADPNDDEAKRNLWPNEARRPWIIARYNAWRDQYVQPPWWHVFLTIQGALRKELRSQVLSSIRLLAKKGGWKRTVVARQAWLGIYGWTRIWLEKFWYQLWNAKFRTQLITLAIAALVLIVAWRAEWASTIFASTDQTKKMVDATVAVLGLVGVSVATILSVVSQSFTPDLDFTAEHKQIGVRDPIGRFRRVFDRMLRHADRPVLLIVDDIDRCEPKAVVELLRGFQTIIRSSRLFVLILGDRSWIEKAHEIHHKDFAGITVGTESRLGERFVEKMFQLSFTLPAMKAAVRERFTQIVLEGTIEEGRPSEPLPEIVTGRTATGENREPEKVIQDPEKAIQDYEEKLVQAVEEAESPEEREARVKQLKKEATDRGVEPARANDLASTRLVAAAASDAGYEREVTKALLGLAASLPNNPRQIKRIISAFAIYDAVGQLYYSYELKGQRWRQLALWVTLATEWPDTWRTLAHEPRLAEAAYAADAAERERMRSALLDEQTSAEAKKAIEATLQRLMHDPLLVRLLGADPSAKPSVAGISQAPDSIQLFATTRIEAAAIREFNRIMWEPGFPMDFAASGPSAPA